MQRWMRHQGSQACLQRQASGLVTRPVSDFFSKRPTTKPTKRAETPPKNPPCPGIHCNTNPLVQCYLRRVSTPGGGAPSRYKIAHALWPKLGEERSKWKNLSKKRQDTVLRREETLYAWRNLFGLGTIVSTQCSGIASTTNQPCEHCSGLLSFHPFQNQLNKKLPKEENMKFVPKAYHSAELGKIYLKYTGVRQLIEAVSHDFHSIQVF